MPKSENDTHQNISDLKIRFYILYWFLELKLQHNLSSPPISTGIWMQLDKDILFINFE